YQAVYGCQSKEGSPRASSATTHVCELRSGSVTVRFLRQSDLPGLVHANDVTCSSAEFPAHITGSMVGAGASKRGSSPWLLASKICGTSLLENCGATVTVASLVPSAE